ncbi:hypothetical protein BG004_002833 [Podila humilis]|nr:hypothetical protein BG004_002833 [Podila humilis]
MIFKNLPLQSLVQCTLANREFCRIASPLVWVVHYDPQTKRNPLGPQYRQSLAKNAHQIESLTIRSEDSLDFFCPPPPPQPQSQPQPNTIDLPRLQELELLVVFRECNQRVQPDYPRILRCIETSLSTIHTLHIGNLLPAEHAIRIAHSQQLHLKDLSLRTKLTVNEAIFFLRELPSHVQSLNLNTISGFRQQLTAEERAPFTTKHDALRSLELRSSCSIKDFDRFLVPFLGTCSTNLKSFRVDNPNPLSNVHVQAALDKLGVEAAEMFTHEDLTSPEAEDEEIADTIHTFSNLEMVIIPDFKKVGQKTVETILALPDMLRVLELPDYGCIRSTDVVLMLSSLKHLERFTVRNPSTVPSLLTTPRLASRTPHPLRDRADSRIRRNSRPPCNIFLSAADVYHDWQVMSRKSTGWQI